ncbi:Las1-like protein [Venturia nashicola]|uniref:Las1-like protein n=1 Tax=Venturia nashicola TaxID=86259 RepID=A0A4Z1NSR5_9PEZI|nr:Las1-like protein [Venturia nashicola]TLD29776.1 Las1-like protein [Venturia nashicola]
MPRPNIRPWRNQAELLSVRKLLYAETDAFRSQQLGVNIVNTWKRRCRVPHCIDFTAALVDARLQHNIEQQSTFTIRALYSTAFARFVTGTCDMGQNSAIKRSMYEMAEDKDMPETWVELRHEITHGQIPDLRVLEFSVDAALAWLWDKFWTNLDAPMEGNCEAQTDIRSVLRSFVASRKEEIKSSQPASRESCATTTRKLLRMCKNSERGMDKLISMLLEDKLMLRVPSQQRSARNMKPAYLIWDDLLQTIAAKRPSFYSTLTERLLNGITHDSVNTEDEIRRTALIQWLHHMTTTSSWQKYWRPSEELRSTILERCITHPDSWSKRLARALLDGSDNNDFQEQWEPYFETSFLDVDSEDHEAPPPRYDLSNNSANNVNHKPNMPSMPEEPRKHPSDIKDMVSIHKADKGWRLWEGAWLPKPIGFPHSHQAEIQ